MSLVTRAIRAIRSVFGSKMMQDDRPTSSGESTTVPTPEPESIASFTLGDNDDSASRCNVRFVGGPLDGHMEGLPMSANELAVIIAIPVSPLHLAKLTGTQPPIMGSNVKLTSVAFYERDLDCLVPPRFLFVAATRVEDVRSLWAKQN